MNNHEQKEPDWKRMYFNTRTILRNHTSCYLDEGLVELFDEITKYTNNIKDEVSKVFYINGKLEENFTDILTAMEYEKKELAKERDELYEDTLCERCHDTGIIAENIKFHKKRLKRQGTPIKMCESEHTGEKLVVIGCKGECWIGCDCIFGPSNYPHDPSN